jgi:hypothetical protein
MKQCSAFIRDERVLVVRSSSTPTRERSRRDHVLVVVGATAVRAGFKITFLSSSQIFM